MSLTLSFFFPFPFPVDPTSPATTLRLWAERRHAMKWKWLTAETAHAYLPAPGAPIPGNLFEPRPPTRAQRDVRVYHTSRCV
ncbi:hypothetical protein GQ53DRAFT_463572 [Thozetella sp. PMI_491]|nr:hypothetical protein GQ53DRAFT_463572 [Thozetella sp. PMI_491]